MAWMEEAACALEGIDPEIFFPSSSSSAVVALAKKVCSKCVVRDECLNYAFEEEDAYGIYGGLTPNERKALKQKMYGSSTRGALRYNK